MTVCDCVSICECMSECVHVTVHMCSQKKQALRPVFCCASGGIWQLARFPFALDWVELALAEAERLRSDFEKLVVEEEVDTLLKGVLGMRSELDGAVRGVGAHVG